MILSFPTWSYKLSPSPHYYVIVDLKSVVSDREETKKKSHNIRLRLQIESNGHSITLSPLGIEMLWCLTMMREEKLTVSEGLTKKIQLYAVSINYIIIILCRLFVYTNWDYLKVENLKLWFLQTLWKTLFSFNSEIFYYKKLHIVFTTPQQISWIQIHNIFLWQVQ